jgi:hypothetical protein
MARYSKAIVLLAAATVLVSGALHLRRTELRRHRRSYRKYRWVRDLVRSERNLSLCWIGVGLGLLVFAIAVASPLVVAAAGMLSTLALFARGRKLLRPVAGGLAVTLTMAVCASSAFGLVIAAEAAKQINGQGGKKAAARSRSATVAGPAVDPARPVPAPPTYAELCPQLPDPMRIGHGLGELFRRDGAVKDGCGGPARNPVGLSSVWVSAGICSRELRSLAVSAPGFEPTVLYGEAARFADRAAGEGELFWAETTRPGGGEVVAIGTGSGSYVFARSSPSIRPGRADAERCSEVGGVARPFAQLSPAMAELWFWHVEKFGWAWPVAAAGVDELEFIDYATGGLAATGRCGEGGECELNGPREHSTYEGPAVVTLDILAPYMPVETG